MGGLMASSMGLVSNIAGLFFDPMAEDLGILRGEASLTVTITNIVLAITGLSLPRLLDKGLIRPVLLVATILLSGGTAALALCGDLLPMYLLCVLRGIGAGCTAYVMATMVLNRWFVANVGLVSSICMGFTGIAGAIFSPITSFVIQGFGWRVAYVVIGVFILLLDLPAVLFVPSLDPEDAGFEAYGADELPEQSAGEDDSDEADVEPARPIVPVVFAMVLAFALFVNAGTALPPFLPSVASNYGLAPAIGATMLSLSMLANTGGKIVLGALIDRFGTRGPVLLYLGLIAGALALLLVARAELALLLGSLLLGLVYALGSLGQSMLTRDAFGLANYGRTYPTSNLVGSMSNAVFSSVVGYMYDFTGGYALPIGLFLVLMVLSVGTVQFVYARAAVPNR